MSDEFPEFNEGDGPVIRDRRRFDPTTGELRPEAAHTAASGAAPAPDGPTVAAEPATSPEPAAADLEAQLAERTADLQRVQAEYANYRRRVERDRQAVGEQALASVLGGLLPVLDDIDRARAHGEANQGFLMVADGLEITLTKLGLDRFGEPGEPFDPTIHEALTHGFSDVVAEPTAAEILQPGYRVGDRVLRPARVAVLEPEAVPPATPPAVAEPADEPEHSDEPAE